MSKKVGIIDHIGIKGGNHYYSLCLLDALSRKGYETFFLSNMEKVLGEENVFVKKIYDENISKTIKGMFQLIFGTIVGSYFLNQRGVKTVIIHLFEASWITLVTCLIFRLFRLKIIAIAHDVESFEKNETALVSKVVYQNFLDTIVAHNHFSFDVIKDKFNNRTSRKTKIIKHGGHLTVINTEITKMDALEKLNLDSEYQYALFFGQIKKVKGLDVLLEAFPDNLPDLKLVVAGKPWKDDFSEYQKIIDKRKINDKVHTIIRYITEEERDLLYNAASFIILPYKEIFQSGVLLMAMSYGLPIIVSDLEANKEVLKSEEALFFESENIADLRKKIQELNDNIELGKDMAKKVQNKIKTDYDWDTISMEYFDLIK